MRQLCEGTCDLLVDHAQQCGERSYCRPLQLTPLWGNCTSCHDADGGCTWASGRTARCNGDGTCGCEWPSHGPSCADGLYPGHCIRRILMAPDGFRRPPWASDCH